MTIITLPATTARSPLNCCTTGPTNFFKESMYGIFMVYLPFPVVQFCVQLSVPFCVYPVRCKINCCAHHFFLKSPYLSLICISVYSSLSHCIVCILCKINCCAPHSIALPTVLCVQFSIPERLSFFMCVCLSVLCNINCSAPLCSSLCARLIILYHSSLQFMKNLYQHCVHCSPFLTFGILNQ